MRNWFDVIQPHEDIRNGHFDEAVFAADLGDVFEGVAPADYNDPYLFFRKTYLTAGLEGLLRRVQAKLATGQGASVIQIQTPFGGGKTHALVAIYHALKRGRELGDLLPVEFDIERPRLSVVSGDHWNALTGQTSVGLTRRTFWGEIAFQVGGRAGYEAFRANDEAQVSPGKAALRDFLQAHQPFVLLFDEILEYINRARDVRGQGQADVALGTQTFSFFQELTEAVASLPNGMLVVTLPSSHLEDFGEKEEESLARLGKIFGRVQTIETPVQGEEVYAVIRRRLFVEESLKQQPMREIVAGYFQHYQAYRDDLPAKARDLNYRDKMEKAFPFHPDVIDILYEKWSTFPSFQRTRGVLRLLANVVEDLYQREVNLDMILPGDLNLDRPVIREEFLSHIGREYEGVIASDIAGHEAKSQALDKANKQWKHLAQRIATAAFFHSFSADDSEKGAGLPYLKLAVLRSETIPALATDVLQKLANSLWYLNSRGESYFFARIPNLNRMILDKKELFNESYEETLKGVIAHEVGQKFRTYLWPETSDGIPDNRELKLVILHPHDNGAAIPEWIERRGQSFREFKGTLYFALAEAAAFSQLREDVKTQLALQEIDNEIARDPDSPLAAKRQEVRDRLHAVQRDYSYKVRRMYHVLRVGERRIDLGQPVTGRETLDGWFWRELCSNDIAAIVEQLHYRMIVNRLMAGNEQVAAGVILDQFYKDPSLPAPASPEVVARAIQLGVQDGAIGLAVAGEDGTIRPEMVRYQETLPLGAISFEPGILVLSSELTARLRVRPEQPVAEPPPPPPTPPTGSKWEPLTGDGPTPPPPDNKYHRVRLVISGIPAGRIADVNRGILIPLSSAVDRLTFTMMLDVASEEGISPETLENRIKETIRQIGARVDEEELH